MAKDDGGGKGSKKSGGGKGKSKGPHGKGPHGKDAHAADSPKAAAKKSGAGSSARPTGPSVDAASPMPTTPVARPAHREVTAPPPATPPSVSAAPTTPAFDLSSTDTTSTDPTSTGTTSTDPAGAGRTNGTSHPDTPDVGTNGTGPRTNGTATPGAGTSSSAPAASAAPTPVTSLSSAAAALRSPSTTGTRATVAGHPEPSTEVAVPAGRAADDITRTLVLPLQIARNVLPAGRTPAYLGAAALALVGIVEWPAALGLGLAWEALRRWGPRAESDR